MAILGVVIGLMAGVVCGAAAYQWVSTRFKSQVLASVVSGLVTTLCASPIFIAFGVHRWLAGPEAPWTAAVFLALCYGICQGVLFKGRPWYRVLRKGIPMGRVPNMRLKLTAPALEGRIAFVKVNTWRRSLGASR